MLQKYIIYNNVEQNELKISEFAVLDKELRNESALIYQQNDYSLVGQERYEQELVLQAISKGREAVIELLRTNNLFPIEPYAKKIAETVIAVFNYSHDNTAELIFNDVDLLSSYQDQETTAV